MKLVLTLCAASSIALAAGTAQALTLENKSSAPAAITVVDGGKSQSLRVAANGRETLPCASRCRVQYKGKQVSASKDDSLVISADGKLQKSTTPMKKDATQ